MSLSTTTPAAGLAAVETSAHLTRAGDIETVIQDEFRSIPQVENVSVEHEDGTVSVWIAADNPMKSLRHKTYAKQMCLMEAFPEVSFDFNLVSAA